MYFLSEIEMVLPIEPRDLRPDKDLKEIALNLARRSLEGQTIEGIGMIIAILDIEIEDIGEIKLRDPNVYFKTILKSIIFKPLKNEIVIGKVENLTESAVYLNIGCIDAVLPVNQISSDRFKYIAKKNELRGTRTREIIRNGDWIRARVVRFHYKVPAEIGALVRGGIVVSSPKRISPKTEISIVLRSKERGLGPEKKLLKERKELLSK
ncbi:MAG: RPB7/RPC8 family DNA-directed RNA polymerase subunit [Candidatus Njordarchaeia archaeon]